MHNISRDAKGSNGAQATYRYQGEWRSLDHMLVSPSLLPFVDGVRIHDAKFLLEEDEVYGGVKPFRTGYRYRSAFSDHLPLVARFRF